MALRGKRNNGDVVNRHGDLLNVIQTTGGIRVTHVLAGKCFVSELQAELARLHGWNTLYRCPDGTVLIERKVNEI